MPAVLALIGIVFLALAGVNVGSARFSPGWLGLAFLAFAWAWGPITAIGG